jgi:hypothetical protein
MFTNARSLFIALCCVGTGKTTLLQILAGHYMVSPDAVRILGRPAFHDISLTSSGDLSYLGQQWRRDVAFAGYNIPLQVSQRLLVCCTTLTDGPCISQDIHGHFVQASASHARLTTAHILIIAFSLIEGPHE